MTSFCSVYGKCAADKNTILSFLWPVIDLQGWFIYTDHTEQAGSKEAEDIIMFIASTQQNTENKCEGSTNSKSYIRAEFELLKTLKHNMLESEWKK